MRLHATTIARVGLAGLTLTLIAGCAGAPPAPAAAPAAAAPAPAPAPAPASAPAAPADEAAPPPSAATPRYRCDHDIAFSVSYGQDSATVQVTPRGRETLLRDAGGVTPLQTVYSNERLRAEFGLGAKGDEAILRYAEPPLVARCRRDERN